MPSNCPNGITPYAQSKIVKNPNIVNLNYTNQDFWSMKSRLVDFIKERFGPEGTVLPNTFDDFIESSIAIMLVENWAFLADGLSFKMDQIANEFFIDTVTEIENAFRIAKTVGFKPQPPIAARSFWIATLNNPILTELRVETPFGIDITSDGTPTRIELFQADAGNNPIFDQDIIIPAGQTINQSIIGLEGRTITDLFVGTGEVGQTVQLTLFPVIFDSVMVFVEGIMWTEVEFFTDSQPRREYRVEFDSNYNGFIIFGNNRAGMIPSQGSNISITYRVGGGIVGNIVTGFVETQTQIFVPGLDFSVPITFRNYTKGEFGYNGDTIEDIRRKLPVWIKTQDRAVTGEDYKTLADQFATPYFGQIGKSITTLRNYGCAANIIDLYILAKDGTEGLTEANNDLKVALTEELNNKKMITDFVCVRDGEIITTDVTIEVTLDRFYRKFELEFKQNILNKVNTFFSINNWEYEQTLRDVDLIKDLSDIKEVQSYDITFTTNNPSNSGTVITAKFNEIIRPDDISVSFMYI